MISTTVCCSYTELISSISLVMPFEWNILSNISMSKIFSWEVGEGPLYWYVVESMSCGNDCTCSNIKCTCPTLAGNFTEYRTMMATSVNHVCTLLAEAQYNRKIKKISRWTEPVLVCDVPADYNGCNELVTVDFCDCACLPFLPPSACSLICSSISSSISMETHTYSFAVPEFSDNFASKPMTAFQPIADPVPVSGYLRPVSVTLKLSHNLSRFPVVGNFIARGLCNIPDKVPLHYSAATDCWQYSQHFMADGDQWSIVFTLFNNKETWTLQANIGRIVGGKKVSSKFRVDLQQVPIDQFMVRTAYDVISGSLSSNCKVHQKTINDELKLFTSGSLILKAGEK